MLAETFVPFRDLSAKWGPLKVETLETVSRLENISKLKILKNKGKKKTTP